MFKIESQTIYLTRGDTAKFSPIIEDYEVQDGDLIVFTVKKVETAILAGDKAAAETALRGAISQISRAASKGVYHKNTASRKIARLTKTVNKMA